MKLGRARCAGSSEPGWVCAKHSAKPWEHDGCEAEGAPCGCNPEGRVDFVKVFASDVPDAPRFALDDDDQGDLPLR